MNRLLTFEGRQPIWLDDLTFLQDSMADEIKKCLEGILGGRTFAILSGCLDTGQTGMTHHFSAGIIYLNGELYRVPASSVYIYRSQYPVMEVVTTYDEDGDRTMVESGEEHSCWQIKTGRIVSSSSVSNRIADENRLDVILGARLGYPEFLWDSPDDYEDGLFRLVRTGHVYTLAGNFKGSTTAYRLTIQDQQAQNELVMSQSGESFWRNGITYGVAGYSYIAAQGVNSGEIPVKVEVTAPESNELRVFITLLGTLPSSAEGGFTMTLNSKTAANSGPFRYDDGYSNRNQLDE